jgi:hypothetical protein
MVGMVDALQDSCITNDSRLPSEVVQRPMMQATFSQKHTAEDRK